MRAYGAFLLVAFTMLLLGCGGEERSATSADATSADRGAGEAGVAQQEVDYPLPRLPEKRGPLKKLVIKDLKVGKGPMVRPGDEVVVRYVGVFWETGKLFSQVWNSPNRIELEQYGPGWEKGLRGMRVGGRREFWIPGALIFDGGTDAAYVVSLVGIKAGGKG
jgi:FKBP-type peptidyl-prolyl cis-trans isomerase